MAGHLVARESLEEFLVPSGQDVAVGTFIADGARVSRVQWTLRIIDGGDRYRLKCGLFNPDVSTSPDTMRWKAGEDNQWLYGENGRYPKYGNTNVRGYNYGSGMISGCKVLIDADLEAGTLQISVSKDGQWQPGRDGKGLPAPEGSPGWANLAGKRLKLFVTGTGTDGSGCRGWEVESLTAITKSQRVLTVVSGGMQEDNFTFHCFSIDGSEVATVSAGLKNDVAWLRAALANRLECEAFRLRLVTADGCLLDDGVGLITLK